MGRGSDPPQIARKRAIQGAQSSEGEQESGIITSAASGQTSLRPPTYKHALRLTLRRSSIVATSGPYWVRFDARFDGNACASFREDGRSARRKTQAPA